MSHPTETGCGVGQRIHFCCPPQRSCGKVMFSQSSLILSTGEHGRHPPPGQVPPGRDNPLVDTPWQALPWTDTPMGRYPPADTPAKQTPTPGRQPPKTATAAGGTHPSGMHYCSLNFHPKLLPVLYHMLDSTEICVFLFIERVRFTNFLMINNSA